MKKEKAVRAIVVTTKNRGVFFGYLVDDSESPETLILSKARMCIYWSTSVKGVLGLAATGPDKDCKITHSIPKLTLYEVSAILDCSPEAAEQWEKSLWK